MKIIYVIKFKQQENFDEKKIEQLNKYTNITVCKSKQIYLTADTCLQRNDSSFHVFGVYVSNFKKKYTIHAFETRKT